MKRAYISLVGLLIAVSFLSFRIYSNSAPHSFPVEAVVKSVIDGDTVQLKGNVLLRYLGIDTPEIRFKKDNTWEYNPEPLALSAKEANEKIVLGKTVRIEYDTEKNDSYKRLLGYVFIEEVFVNEYLLKNGHAFLMVIEPNLKYLERLQKAQSHAKENNLGLWAEARAHTVDAEKAFSEIGRIAQVQGTVLHVIKMNKVTFLNFGDNYKEDFTGVIFKSSFDRINRRIPIYDCVGKTISIIGIIKEYNGPEIIINSADQIEIIKN